MCSRWRPCSIVLDSDDDVTPDPRLQAGPGPPSRCWQSAGSTPSRSGPGSPRGSPTSHRSSCTCMNIFLAKFAPLAPHTATITTSYHHCMPPPPSPLQRPPSTNAMKACSPPPKGGRACELHMFDSTNLCDPTCRGPVVYSTFSISAPIDMLVCNACLQCCGHNNSLSGGGTSPRGPTWW